MIKTGAKSNNPIPGTYCLRIGKSAVITASGTQMQPMMRDGVMIHRPQDIPSNYPEYCRGLETACSFSLQRRRDAPPCS
jgi:hypothetical protein